MSRTPLEVNARKTPPVQEIILRIPQPNYKAASPHRIPHRPLRRRSLFNMAGRCPYWTSNSASTGHLICLRSRYCAYIIMHLKYHGHRRKRNKDGPTSTPIYSLVFLTIFLFFTILSTDGSKAGHPRTLSEFGFIHSSKSHSRQGVP